MESHPKRQGKLEGNIRQGENKIKFIEIRLENLKERDKS
jgi:hypothetical protein